jgi:Dolichyl-phosphate-mannose-protein mannosyltransferase
MNDALKRIVEKEGRPWWKIAALLAVLVILFAPSVWMLATIPPLWKDVDAYGQVTAPPGEGTILLYGPAYCFLARIPLYLGLAYNCWRAGLAWPSLSFFLQPKLTDAGVFLLLLIQHLALCASACLLIVSVTPRLLVRVTIAVLWATNPLFYIWAHCVSTETLSMILVLLLAVAGLRILSEPKWQWWLCYGILFTLSMLTRHINGVLGALLPLTFGFAGVICYLLLALRQRKLEARQGMRRQGARDLRQAFFAIVVGLLCILLSAATLRLLSRAVGIPYHSTVGFTFMFRLGLFASLSPAERDEVIRHAVRANPSPDVRTLLEAFRDAPSREGRLDVGEVLGQTRKLLPATCLQGDNFARLLNETARACLLSPSSPYLRAVRIDFGKSFIIPIGDVIAAPFVHTIFYFSHPESMPQCAHLDTFQNHDRSSILGQLHSYGGGHRILRYHRLLLGWLVLVLIFAWRERAQAIALSAYTFAFNATGFLMTAANCLLNEFQSRYTLTAWELLVIAVVIMLGALPKAELTARRLGNSNFVVRY